MKISLGEVLAFKWPGAKFQTHGNNILSWNHSSKEPSDVEIEAAKSEYLSFKASVLYKEKRAGEYPSIEDQLDAIWKGGQDMEAMRQQILAVKAKYPKP